jgi:hypothetical protein
MGSPNVVVSERSGHDPETNGRGTEGRAGGPRRWRHRRAWFVLLALPLVPIGAYVAWGWLREPARPVSLSEAGIRFHREHPGVAQGAGPLTPSEGVYQYIGHGSDKISVPPMSQSHGPTIPGTITHGSGSCWTLRVDYSSNHWQDWTYCPRNGGLDEQAGRTFQRWDIAVTSIDNRSSFVCRSRTLVPGMQAGDSWTQTCIGNNSSIPGTTTSSGLMRFLGIETLRIGADRVRAYHLLQHRQVTGSQRGTLISNEWFAFDGLPIREQHTLKVVSPSPIGDITYREVTNFRLADLHPRR